MRRDFIVSALCIIVGLVNSAAASILLDEPFNYSDGSLLANSGGNWTAVSGSALPLTVMNNAIVGLSHGPGTPSREDLGRAPGRQYYQRRALSQLLLHRCHGADYRSRLLYGLCYGGPP